jgi:hypothetical protein
MKKIGVIMAKKPSKTQMKKQMKITEVSKILGSMVKSSQTGNVFSECTGEFSEKAKEFVNDARSQDLQVFKNQVLIAETRMPCLFISAAADRKTAQMQLAESKELQDFVQIFPLGQRGEAKNAILNNLKLLPPESSDSNGV